MSTETEIIRQTAGMVVEHLDGYTVDTTWEPTHNARMVGPDGAVLFLTLVTSAGNTWGSNMTHVQVSGAFPSDAYRVLGGRYERHSIKVRKDRGPDVIAREIERRLLPGYLPELTRVQEAIASHNEGEAARDAAVARLADIMPGAWGAGDGSVRLGGDPVWGDVEVYHGGESASLTLRSVPVNLAARILRLIADA